MDSLVKALGPLFADVSFRQWLEHFIVLYILVGYFPEEHVQEDGKTKKVIWRGGGVVRAFIQQSVEMRELRLDIRTLISKIDKFTLAFVESGGSIPRSDPPPARSSRTGE